MKYVVTVTTTGGPMTDAHVADLGRLGARVLRSDEPQWCEATFRIEASDEPSASALAIEGVRAVRGDVTVDAVAVVPDPTA